MEMTVEPEHITLPVHNLAYAGGGALTIERVPAHTPGVVQIYINAAGKAVLDLAIG